MISLTSTSNSAAFLAELDQESAALAVLGDARGVTASNDADYAGPLQRRGYIVLDERVLVGEVDGAVAGMLAQPTAIGANLVRTTLRRGANRAIRVMQSFTGKLRPPAGVAGSGQADPNGRSRLRGGGGRFVALRGGPRRAHFGGWADVTKNLASRYFYQTPGDPLRQVPYDAGDGEA